MRSKTRQKRARQICSLFGFVSVLVIFNSNLHAETVGYWRFEEGTGSTANDSSSFGNTGTITVPNLYNTDVPTATIPSTGSPNNYSLHFDGGSNPTVNADPADQFVTVPDSTSLRPETAITVEASIKLDQNVVGNAGIVSYYIGGSSGDSYQLGLRGEPGSGSNDNYAFFGVQLGSGWVGIDLNTPLNVGQWYNLVGTWNGSVVDLYVNGVLAGSA